MGNDGKGSTGKSKSKSKSKSKGTGATETTGETKRRAMAITRRLARFAVAGFPPLEQLKARVAQFYARVDKKLGAVPRQRQTFPPATIVAPAAFQYALLGESDEVADLREMFENLLVAAMDRDTAASAHPAFVAMISQLTPDEARILKSIDRRQYAAYNLLVDRTPEGYALAQSPPGFRTLLGIDLGIKQPLLQQCISNLERIGVLRTDWGGQAVVPGSEWDQLKQRMEAEFPDGNGLWNGGSVSVTALGQQFLDTCVRTKR